MSDEYHVRKGTRRKRTPVLVGDHYSIPYREMKDDGAKIIHVGFDPPVCLDCNTGNLVWAEAGFVPWHRICNVCGSHWLLSKVPWGPARSRERARKELVYWVLGEGEMAIDPEARVDAHSDPVFQDERTPTWKEFIAKVTPDMWDKAESDRDNMLGMAVIPCSWATRARFYMR